jgi:uncharacterized protein YjiK
MLIISACGHKHDILTPKGYNITQPERTELGSKLREISGILWVNENVMVANNDEAGKIFVINLKDKTDFNYPSLVFGQKGDYEDITVVDSTAYLLISNGQIVEVRGYRYMHDTTGVIIASIGGAVGENEFETLYYDKEVNSLIMLCKSCHKEKNMVRTAYRYDLTQNRLIDTPYYKIDINAIRTKLNDPRQDFYPSAAAINPVQNKLYIVSSIGKVLVVCDKHGVVEKAIPLSPSDFPQPEGITFAPNGDMYISNEGGDDRGTLLKFAYKP